VLARPQLPGYWLDPSVQPAPATKYAAPSARGVTIGPFASERLLPYEPTGAQHGA